MTIKIPLFFFNTVFSNVSDCNDFFAQTQLLSSRVRGRCGNIMEILLIFLNIRLIILYCVTIGYNFKKLMSKQINTQYNSYVTQTYLLSH